MLEYFQGTGSKVDVGSMTGTVVVHASEEPALKVIVVDGSTYGLVLDVRDEDMLAVDIVLNSTLNTDGTIDELGLFRRGLRHQQ